MAKRSSISYSPKLAAKICDLIAEGESLRTIGEMDGMPSRRTMRGWLNAHPEFEREYEIARRERTDNLVDEAVEIADSVTGSTDAAEVNAARLQVDTRKWLASKLLPERFGDKVTTEVTGPGGKDLLPEQQLMDNQKIALFLLGIFNNLPGGKNDPARMTAALPVTAATTLLSGLSEPAEPVPVRIELEPVVETEAMRREHRRWTELTGPRNWRVIQ
jgi:hypothetical protein